MPSEMKVRVRNGRFKEVFWAGPVAPANNETITLQLDGQEHIWSKGNVVFPLDVVPATTYSAQLNGDLLVLTKYFKSSHRPEGLSVERWALRNGGKELVVSGSSEGTVLQHASWFRSLFTNDP